MNQVIHEESDDSEQSANNNMPLAGGRRKYLSVGDTTKQLKPDEVLYNKTSTESPEEVIKKVVESSEMS